MSGSPANMESRLDARAQATHRVHSRWEFVPAETIHRVRREQQSLPASLVEQMPPNATQKHSPNQRAQVTNRLEATQREARRDEGANPDAEPLNPAVQRQGSDPTPPQQEGADRDRSRVPSEPPRRDTTAPLSPSHAPHQQQREEVAVYEPVIAEDPAQSFGVTRCAEPQRDDPPTATMPSQQVRRVPAEDPNR